MFFKSHYCVSQQHGTTKGGIQRLIQMILQASRLLINREYHALTIFKLEHSKPIQAIAGQGQKGMPNPYRCAWPSWHDRDGAHGSSHPQRWQIMETKGPKGATEDMFS
jgi:hypothetical protein